MNEKRTIQTQIELGEIFQLKEGFVNILLMDEILHHLGWLKPVVNNGIIIILGGAGFLSINSIFLEVGAKMAEFSDTKQTHRIHVWYIYLHYVKNGHIQGEM